MSNVIKPQRERLKENHEKGGFYSQNLLKMEIPRDMLPK